MKNTKGQLEEALTYTITTANTSYHTSYQHFPRPHDLTLLKDGIFEFLTVQL